MHAPALHRSWEEVVIDPIDFEGGDADTTDKRRYDDDGVVSEPRWPGLQLFEHRAGNAKRFSAAGVDVGASEGPMTMVASLPLFDEERWQPIAEGTVLALRDGEIVARVDGS